jgi:hypothetical protein
MAGAIIEVKYFNTFLLKQVNKAATEQPVWNGSFGVPGGSNGLNGGYPVNATSDTGGDFQWSLEESRIRGGYNNTSTDYGAKAYIVEDEPQSSNRVNSLIYSGIFNSRTGVNKTNVFSVAEDITKSVDPANGSIQRLYAEDTNLTIFQELKCSRALIDKDAIYSAEGGGTVTSSNLVIGVIQPYTGEYGISTNPESFAVYGYRKYFSDVNNNVILRLSKDGLTEISSYGMKDFFRDKLGNSSTNFTSGKIIGGYDIHNSEYVVSIQSENAASETINFDERVQGWVSFFSYAPDQAFSLRNNFYTVKTVGGNASVNGAVTASPNLIVDGVQNFIEQYSTVELIVQGVPNYTAVPLGTTVVSFNSTTGALVLSGNVTLANNDFLTFGGVAQLWRHYDLDVPRSSFYGKTNAGAQSNITFVFNPNPTNSKTFKTIAYEGSNGWQADSFLSDSTGRTLNVSATGYNNSNDSIAQISSYGEGEYVLTQGSGITLSATTSNTVSLNTITFNGRATVGSIISGVGVDTGTTVISYNTLTGALVASVNMNITLGAFLTFSGAVSRTNYNAVFGTNSPSFDRYYAGFVRKENKYVANLINNTSASSGEVLFGNAISGIKGFYGTVKLSTDLTTDLGGEKTLFSVESVYTMNNGY